MSIYGNDPLLGERTSLEQLERQNEMYAQKLQELQNIQVHGSAPQRTSTPIWDEIDKIVSSLNEQEKAILEHNRDYYENSLAIQSMVNAEILSLVRGSIEASPDGKVVLEQQLSLVKRMSKAAKEETAQRDALFREYITEHSNMTWQEFMNMKKGGKQ